VQNHHSPLAAWACGMEVPMKRILFAVFAILLIAGVGPRCAAQAQNVTQDKATIQAVALTHEITPPRLTEVASPDYTAEAKKKKIEGSVTVAIVVDKKGDVVDAKVVNGLGHGLDENAILAVKEWKYKPAEKNGVPVAVKMNVQVDFYLHD
jgi:TonB family protein